MHNECRVCLRPWMRLHACACACMPLVCTLFLFCGVTELVQVLRPGQFHWHSPSKLDVVPGNPVVLTLTSASLDDPYKHRTLPQAEGPTKILLLGELPIYLSEMSLKVVSGLENDVRQLKGLPT